MIRMNSKKELLFQLNSACLCYFFCCVNLACHEITTYWPQDVPAWAQEFFCSFDWSDERLNAFINSLDGGSPGPPDTVDITSSILEKVVDEPDKEEVANVDTLLDDGTHHASAANVESRPDNGETQCQSDLFSSPPFPSLNEHPDWIANFGNTLRKSEVDEHAVEAQGSSSSSWQPRFPQLEAAHVEQKLEESKKHLFGMCEEVLHMIIFLPSAFWRKILFFDFPQSPTRNDLCTGIDGANVCVLVAAMPGTHGCIEVGESRVT